MKLKIVGAVLLLAASGGFDVVRAASPAPVVSHPSSSAMSQPLSDLPTDHWVQTPGELKLAPRPKPLPPRGAGPGEPNSGGKSLQKEPAPRTGIQPKANFPGVGANGYIPPDPNIAVGPNHIVQMVNSELAVFNKSTGSVVMAPVSLSSLWQPLGGPCASSNNGDPIVQYDAVADRWLISELSSVSGPYGECIGVSQTNDPTKAYYLYYFQIPNYTAYLNDYPKFGVWSTTSNSAYLASYNLFQNGQTFYGAAMCAYDRQAMMQTPGAAEPPTQICFIVPGDGGFLPADLDGKTPPADGTPGYFLNFETHSSLRLYALSPDFANPSSSTLTQASTDIAINSFAPACGSTGTCIVQPNNQQLDSLGDRLMYRLAYRVFSDHAAMVVNHSVTAGSSVGVRWYELRQPSGGAFSLYQQGTFAPDSAYRWMGSAAMDKNGDIAIGYSKSSGTVYPSIAFAARAAGDPLGTMGAESILQAGSGAQTSYSRWGDYTALRIDPSDDTTFWYTNEYYTKNRRLFNYQWATAIGSFTVGGGGGGGTPDFTLTLTSPSLTVTRGSSKTDTVVVTAPSGSPAVTLSASGLLSGTSASFSPNPVTATTAGSSSTLTIKANRKAQTGSSTVKITGSDSSGTSSVSLIVSVH